MTEFRPPRGCPVCQTRLHLTQLGCPHCGTGLSGDFEPCQFCALDDAELDILRVFLASRGNMKELERHLGLSYPTVRARFDDLLATLGLADGPAPPEGFEPPAAANGDDRVTTGDPRRATLEALAKGDIDVATARASLVAEPAPTPKGRPAAPR